MKREKYAIGDYDTYLVRVDELRDRAAGCTDKVPCLTFTCFSSHHRGSRKTPWCRGGDDSQELKHALGNIRASIRSGRSDVGWCDGCWAKTMDGYTDKVVRDAKRYNSLSKQEELALRERVRSRGTWIPKRSERHV